MPASSVGNHGRCARTQARLSPQCGHCLHEMGRSFKAPKRSVDKEKCRPSSDRKLCGVDRSLSGFGAMYPLTGGVALWGSRAACSSRALALVPGCTASSAGTKAHFSEIFRGSRLRQLRKRDGRFDICAALRAENPVVVAREAIGGKMEPFKKLFKVNGLQKSLNHVCVLFVQHLSENALQQAARSCSFVACARSFGILVMRRRGASRSRPVF